jgi:hypothetical protein
MKYSGRGDNKSPEFEFHWNLGTQPGTAPDALKTYAVVFHDVENSSNKTTVDTLHWLAFNIPGSAKGLPEGIGTGDLADGTRNGPGNPVGARRCARLFRAGSRSGTDSSLCVRILRAGYETRSAGEYDTRRTAEGDGWAHHPEGGVVRALPCAAVGPGLFDVARFAVRF